MLSILWIVLIVIASLVFSNVYLSCVLYTLCCQFSGLSLFWLPLWYSLTFICPVSCIPYVVDCIVILWIVLILIASLVFSNVYLSCVLYTLCCQFSGLSLFWLPLWYSLTFIGPVSCIPYVVNSLDCPYLIASLVFSNVYCPVSCIPYVVNSLDCPYFDCLFGIL